MLNQIKRIQNCRHIFPMKNTLKKFTSSTAGLVAVAALLAGAAAHAANYAGNLDTGFGGAVGNGVLSVSDDGTNITFNLERGISGNLDNALVIYIDTGAPGFASTTNFNDNADGGRGSISGYGGTGQQSVLTFTNGFRPSYAISIQNSFAGVFKLANGGANSLTYITGTGQSGANNSANYGLTFGVTNLGMTPLVSTNIRIFGTFISGSGYRSTEAIAGNDAGVQGWNPFSQTSYGTYFFDTVVPTLKLNFAVDMTAQLSSNYFNLGNNFNPATDTVYCGGSFEATPFTFGSFQLTNNPAAVGAATNIYYGSYLTTDLTNTLETYKFKYTHVVTGVSTNDIYDEDPNRSFMLASNNQTVPLVYFDDIAASPSATTNYIKFNIDMGTAIALGTFTPANGDLIEVFGTFESPRWSGNFPTIGHLTNNPAAANTNLYTGTFADGNYPGTQHQYRYAIVTTNPSTIYENIANRTLVTPAGSGNLATNYFANISSIYSNNVTFSVDMTVPILAGAFNPGAGDAVYAAGSFQTNTWTPGAFLLTNRPAPANTNVYYGTYADVNTPGINEFYKFVFITSGAAATNWENNNRIFLLGGTAQTNPTVFWNDVNTNAVLLVPTTITFTVNLTNAVDIYGNAFDHANDYVIINGDFLNPTWPNNWTDAGVLDDYATNVMVETGSATYIYTKSFTLPAGHSLYVSYKYGIDENMDSPGGGLNNTNYNNESPSGNDHHRYVRAAGSYAFPMDTFGGALQTNSLAATEPLAGNVNLGKLTAGNLPVTWLGGLPGVYLQVNTNLANSAGWQDITNTSGGSQTNWPVGGGNWFFRLHNTR